MSDLGLHELLDRAMLAHDFFNSNVLNHPRLTDFPNLHRMAKVADAALAELYQAIGQVRAETVDLQRNPEKAPPRR